MMKNIQLLLLTLIALCATVTTASAQNVTDAVYRQGEIVVDWNHTVDIDEVALYTVYGISNTGSGTVEISALAEGQVSAFLDHTEQGVYYFHALSSGINTLPNKVFVSATFTNGDTIVGNTMWVDTMRTQDLYFYAADEKVAFGQSYLFTPQVAGFTNSELNFELIEAPTGATLHQSSHTVAWTPTQQNIDKAYTFTLKVTTKDGQKSFVGEWTVYVEECVQELSVAVVDEEGNSVSSGMVSIYQWSENSNNTLMRVAYAAVNSSVGGEVEFELFPGEYLVEYNDHFQEYEREWYNDAEGLEDAELLEIGCENSVEITMEVSEAVTEELVRFSGFVELEGLTSQAMVTIEFIGIDPDLPEHEQLERAHYFRKDVWLTPSGRSSYSIDVPTKFHYYASVNTARGSGNLPIIQEYFEEAETLSDAVLLKPNDFNVSVDFTPELNTFGQGGFMGMVRSAGGEVVPSMVIATRTTSRTGAKWSFRARVETTDTGTYSFIGIPDGEYIVQAVPHRTTSGPQYLPGYYKANSEAVDTWEEATVIIVDGKMVGVYHDIILTSQVIESEAEDRIITGKVTKTSGGIKHGTGEVNNENSVEEASVVVSGNGLLVFGTTTSEGTYSVRGLEPGEYTLSVDFPGLEPFVTSIEIGFLDTEVIKDVEMQGVVSSVETQDLTSKVFVHGGYLTVEVGDNHVSNVSVYSLNGTQLAKTESQILSLTNFSSGTYMVVVEFLGNVEVHTIQIVR